jgi:hypothetical protein
MSADVQTRFKELFCAFDAVQRVPILERAAVGSKRSKKRRQKERNKSKTGKAGPVKIDDQTYMPLSKVTISREFIALSIRVFCVCVCVLVCSFVCVCLVFPHLN